MNKEEVLKLAKLARIDVSEEEARGLAGEFEAILGYVGEIKNAKVSPMEYQGTGLINVMREDEGAHEPGIYTEAILNEAPSKEGQYVKVKKIL